MRVLKIAACLMFLPVSAYAGAKENVLHHFAQAIATTRLCPRIEANTGMMAMVALQNDIDLEEAQPALQAEIQKQMQVLSGRDPEIACVAGLTLYGPNGTNVKDFVRER